MHVLYFLSAYIFEQNVFCLFLKVLFCFLFDFCYWVLRVLYILNANSLWNMCLANICFFHCLIFLFILLIELFTKLKLLVLWNSVNYFIYLIDYTFDVLLVITYVETAPGLSRCLGGWKSRSPILPLFTPGGLGCLSLLGRSERSPGSLYLLHWHRHIHIPCVYVCIFNKTNKLRLDYHKIYF